MYRVPMSAGAWVASTDDSPAAALPRALYQAAKDPDTGALGYDYRGDLPYVHARIVRRDGSGRRSGTDYLISAGRDGPRTLVTHAHVRSGEWAGAVGIPLSDDPKIIQAAGAAIRYMPPLGGEYASEAEAVPRIGPGGKVTVPVPEALPAGYFDAGPLAPAEALARWRDQIVPVAVATPKLALIMGASCVSPYIGALARQSHVVNMDGDSDRGKTTAMRVAAGIWGDPFPKGGLVGSWAGTRVRLPRRLGLLGILPCFLDERGMADFQTPAEWGKAIYAITDGPREVAESRGPGLRLTAPWDGVLISAGNGSLLDGLGAGPYAGVGVKRVVSLRAPFTRSADEAEAVIDALRDAYGHPGLAVIERYTVMEVARLIRDAIPLVGMPAGGNPRSLAKNLHGHVAGAAVLDQVLGTGTALRDAAAGAARDYLAEHGHDPEHDADRMLALIRDCMTSQPARWPTVSEYREHRLPRPGYGQDGAPVDPGRVDLPQHGVDRNVAGVRADDGSWFAVVGSALDELLARAGADRAAALAEADRRGWLHRTASDRRGRKMSTLVYGVGRMVRFALPAEAEDEDRAHEPAPDLPPLPPEPPAGEWGEDEDQDEPEPEPEPAPEPEPEPEPEPAPGPATHSLPYEAEVRAYLADCAATPRLDKRYHPTVAGAVKMICHRGPAQAAMIRDAYAAVTGASAGDGDPDVSPEPDPEPEPEPGPEPGPEPAPEPAGWDEDRARARTANSPARRRATDDEEMAAWARIARQVHPGASDDEIAAALGVFHAATGGIRWVSYPGQVGQAWFAALAAQHPSMVPPAPLTSARAREVAGSAPLVRINYVARRPAGAGYVTAYDLNGQHAAAAGSAELGDGEPQVITSPRSIDGLTGLPGYVLLARDLRTGHPALGIVAGGQWVAMPLITYMTRDLGLTVPAAEVVYWPRHGRRLAVYVSRYRAARAKLMGAAQTVPARVALGALKAQVNAFVGMFRSEAHSHGGYYRPDWYDMIVATAEANALRALAKCHPAPVAKMADTAYWVTRDGPCEPAGLTVSTQLGKWKLDRHGRVSADLLAALRDGMPGAVRDAVIRIDAERRAGS